MFSRIKKIVLSVVMTTLITTISVFIISYVGDFNNIEHIFTAGIGLLLLELIVMTLITYKIEKNNIVKYLKGGL